MAKATCSIDGCERTARLRGWCQPHYMRWYRNGDPEQGVRFNQKPPEDGICTIGGCDKPHSSRGWCATHYMRWRVHGDPNHVEYSQTGKFGSEHPAWKGDEVGYGWVHERLKRERGFARNYDCTNCGSRASDWAYDGLDPDQKIDPGTGWSYTSDLDHYIPLCRSCHKKFDVTHKAECKRGHALSGTNLYITPDGRRQCKACNKIRNDRLKGGG